MSRSKYNFSVWVLVLSSSVAAGCGLCGGSETDELKSGTYQTRPGKKLTFPVVGIQQKIMVYDKQTNTLTITYNADSKLFVETWTIASMSR